MPTSLDLLRMKGSDRIQINNILAAASITILSVLLSFSDQPYSPWIVVQLASATPMLVTSSLAYAKLSYRQDMEFRRWDGLGWITLSLGYIMILNSVGLLLHTRGYPAAAGAFLGVAMALFIVYTGVDVYCSRKRIKEKAVKLAIYAALLSLGSVLPILAGWI